MILIYHDSQILELEWLPFLKFPHETKIVNSFIEYRDTPADYKIAFTAHRLHCDHDANCPAYQGFEEKINALSRTSDLVFNFESELHNYHWTIWEQCHHDNVYWLNPGAVNDREDINSHIIHWADFFKLVARMYRELPHKLDLLHKHTEPRPRYFDALLGSPKPHRDFVYHSVKQQGLEDKFIMTYGGQWNDNKFYAQDYFVWEPGCVPQQKIIGTADYVLYENYLTPLSHVIPTAVFNDTAYSIIAETDHDNTLSFFSEKTAKALVARRLFVAFSGYKFLHNLRSLGFETFGSVIDESYDNIIDDQQRYQAAFEQVKWLCNQPQQEILQKIQPIVEHNFNLIMRTDWTDYAIQRIQKVIDGIF